jgi:hypothetical protein
MLTQMGLSTVLGLDRTHDRFLAVVHGVDYDCSLHALKLGLA